MTIPLCANLKYAVLEQLGNGLQTPESRQLFQQNWETQQWAPHMLETVIRIAQKWENGFA